MTHTIEQLDAITRFIPVFEAQGFVFSEVIEPTQTADGFWSMGAIYPGEDGMAFVKACYDHEWIMPFDWNSYSQTDEARQLRDDPNALAQATDDQLAKLLTIVIRKNRFNDGELDAAFSSGLLLGILKRAERLASDFRHYDEGQRNG
ncbi:hypothetical protein FV219_03865 [Methylobacterium sp. WL122]|nr:hypothetical protein FV219_03865 [Methylobacterium sp. WL122]